ncbi:hypothetical protein ACQPW3_38805 [Actinosynnema sp. CA-248983]
MNHFHRVFVLAAMRSVPRRWRAASEIAADCGLENATVEAVCRKLAADGTVESFSFNYSGKPRYRFPQGSSGNRHDSLTIGGVKLLSVIGARLGDERNSGRVGYSEIVFVRLLWCMLQQPERQWKTSYFMYELRRDRRTVQAIFDDLTAVGHVSKTTQGLRRDNTPKLALYKLTDAAIAAYHQSPATKEISR